VGFFDWYERHITESMLVTAVILYLQIPHTVTAAECFFGDHEHAYLFGKNIVLDFLLYGIDLLEMKPIVSTTLAIISKIRHKFI
jgi:hypothetical protein